MRILNFILQAPTDQDPYVTLSLIFLAIILVVIWRIWKFSQGEKTSETLSKEAIMKRSTIFSIGMLIAFFLPWYHISFFSVNGYDLPTTLDKWASVAKSVQSIFKTNSNSDYDSIAFLNKLSYALYIIPICCAINIFGTLTDKKFPSFLTHLQFIIGLLFSSVIFIKGGSQSSYLTPQTDIGFYLTIIFSLLGIFIRDKKVQTTNSNNNIVSSSFEEKSSLLNQLSQLQSLKEKNIISEEIYEKQRQEILQKLENQKEVIQKIEVVETAKTIDEDSLISSLPPEKIEIIKTAEEIAQEEEILKQQKIKQQKNKKRDSLIIKILVAVAIVFVLYRVIQTSSSSNSDVSNTNSGAVSTNNENKNETADNIEKHFITNASESHKVYFHNLPDPATIRKAYIDSREDVIVKMIKNGFGFIEIANEKGQVSVGWVDMKDLIEKP